MLSDANLNLLIDSLRKPDFNFRQNEADILDALRELRKLRASFAAVSSLIFRARQESLLRERIVTLPMPLPPVVFPGAPPIIHGDSE